MLVSRTVGLSDRHSWYLRESYSPICPLRLADPVLDRSLDCHLLVQLSNNSSVIQLTCVMKPLICTLHSNLSLRAEFCGTYLEMFSFECFLHAGWPLLYEAEGRSLGIQWPKGLLIHGPAGCGKTALVHTVAEQYNVSVKTITSASVYGAYTGETLISRSLAMQSLCYFTKGRKGVPLLDFCLL